MKRLLIMKLVFILIFSFWAEYYAQTVQTQYGPVTGRRNGTVYEFLGIPYAAPPVDSLRWKPPQAPDNWTLPILANSYPPPCPQKRYEQGDTTFTLEGDEDCLYLNIWTPQIGVGNKPVMVFIHGGGNQQGSTSQLAGGTRLYDGKNLSQRGDVVVVTIQYRLGVLGYLVHPGLERENQLRISGNYGIMDQIFALQWIQNNIENFGGNPHNVTIFGESAGGVNVGNLLTSPLSKGLFHRAIIQSAAPVIEDYDEAKTKGIHFVNEYIPNGTDSAKIAFMRTVQPDRITIKMSPPLEGGISQMNWGPVIDHYVFIDAPKKTFQAGNFNKVPVIIGSNAEEMSLAAPATVVPSMVTGLINKTVPSEYQSQALALYPPGANAAEARNSYIAILTDAQFTSPTRRTAQCISKNQTEPVWRYFFTHKHTLQQLESFGSYHGMELFYVFNNWENATLGSGPLFKPDDEVVQKVMLAYWTNFAKTGNPNGPGLTLWPRYLSETDCYLEINAHPTNQMGLRTAQSDLWDKAVGFTDCTPLSDIENEKITSSKFILYHNYPNPFNPTTKICFYLPKSENVMLNVFNVIGEQVAILVHAFRDAGKYEVEFDGSKLGNGIYFYQLRVGDQLQSRKMVMLK